jgi:uncharacterized repeat protein (TIGR01451 family)
MFDWKRILDLMKLKSLIIFLVVLATVVPALAITAPANFNAVPYPAEKVVLSWGSVPGAAGYNLYRKSAEETDYIKVNTNVISSSSYEDKNVAQGKDYEYYVAALDVYNAESERSKVASAPHMFMEAEAKVSHPSGSPVIVKSVATKKMVSVAVPGDIIDFVIRIGNNGYGSAMNALVTYPIPDGTKLIPTSINSDKFKADVSYFDKQLGQWVSEVVNDESISKVRFKILDPIKPLVRGFNGELSFKVLIET